MVELATAGGVSLADFLAWERQQPERYERVGGVVRMMTGGTLDHRRIMDDIVVLLRPLLAGGDCRAYAGDIKVSSPAGDVMYPDVLVLCGRHDGKTTIVHDPTVVVEVLSDSTAALDQGRKRWAYQSIPSLRHYVLVDQNEPMVEVASRDQDDSWRSVITRGLPGRMRLEALGATLPLADVFADVVFPAARSEEPTPRG